LCYICDQENNGFILCVQYILVCIILRKILNNWTKSSPSPLTIAKFLRSVLRETFAIILENMKYLEFSWNQIQYVLVHNNTYGAHTKRRKTKCRKTKCQMTKRRHIKTSTTTKCRNFFLLGAIHKNEYWFIDHNMKCTVIICVVIIFRRIFCTYPSRIFADLSSYQNQFKLF
jgi:hypothetical protein